MSKRGRALDDTESSDDSWSHVHKMPRLDLSGPSVSVQSTIPAAHGKSLSGILSKAKATLNRLKNEEIDSTSVPANTMHSARDLHGTTLLPSDSIADHGTFKPNFGYLTGTTHTKALVLNEHYQVSKYIMRYLRSYQETGIKWMFQQLTKYRGALLCDDMGLGKTAQCIALLSALMHKTGLAMTDEDPTSVHGAVPAPEGDCFSSGRSVKPALILVPASLARNWMNELQQWGYFRAVDYNQLRKQEREYFLHDLQHQRIDVVVCSHYAAVQERSTAAAELQAHKWGVLVVDEAHEFRNPASKSFTGACKYDAELVVGLTGTPIQNSLIDIWPVLKLVYRESVPTKSEFSSKYSRKASHSIFQKEIWERFVLQRQKADVLATELPTKTETAVFCKLSKVQAAVYQRALASKDFAWLHDAEDFHGPLWQLLHANRGECAEGCGRRCMTFPCMMRLRWIANHLELLKPAANEKPARLPLLRKVTEELLADDAERVGGLQSTRRLELLSDTDTCGKLAILDRILTKELALGSRVLLFSRSVRLLEVLDQFLKTRVRYKAFTGSMTTADRQAVVDEFNTGTTLDLLLISLKAGGVGLNLTAANVVIIFDPDWNPGNDDQAQARAYRIGQRRNVLVYRLIAAGTVEELAYLRQIGKAQMRLRATTGDRKLPLVDMAPLSGLKAIFRYEPDGFSAKVLPVPLDSLGEDAGQLVLPAELAAELSKEPDVQQLNDEDIADADISSDAIASTKTSVAGVKLASELVEESQSEVVDAIPISVASTATRATPARHQTIVPIDVEDSEASDSTASAAADTEFDFLKQADTVDVVSHVKFLAKPHVLSAAHHRTKASLRRSSSSAGAYADITNTTPVVVLPQPTNITETITATTTAITTSPATAATTAAEAAVAQPTMKFFFESDED